MPLLARHECVLRTPNHNSNSVSLQIIFYCHAVKLHAFPFKNNSANMTKFCVIELFYFFSRTPLIHIRTTMKRLINVLSQSVQAIFSLKDIQQIVL